MCRTSGINGEDTRIFSGCRGLKQRLDNPDSIRIPKLVPRQLRPESGRYDLRASPEDIRAWAKAAKRERIPLAAWIRRALADAASKEKYGR